MEQPSLPTTSKNNARLFGVLILVLVGLSGTVLLANMVNRQSAQPTDSQASEPAVLNYIEAMGHPAGNVAVINRVSTLQSSFVVMQEAGGASSVLGVSPLLTSGIYEGVEITLSRNVQSESLTASLYGDNGNGEFNPLEDTVMKDAEGFSSIIAEYT